MAASSTAAALSRTSRLRTGFSRGLDASLAACTADDFCDSFATLGASNRDDLRSLYLQAQAQARENATAEFDNFVSEHGTGESLDKLDSLIARQPELPDGTRLPLTSVDEARNLIAQATLPAKRQHKLQLEQALREVEEENAGLQAQYAAALPELQAASAEIAACKAQVEKTAVSCERWRAENA